VFDDFIAAAEYLIREGYTRPARLAISGRSNGGLLIGAALTQRPDLFGAALPAVGVLDMLRYQTASANARQWSSDYGLSDNAADFAAQYAYSPYHNVHTGTCYPPTLITTADHDDRVVPWHSFKFAAALQHAQGCANPVLIRIETRAGHGAGKPLWMQIDDYADQWAFAAQALGMDSSSNAAGEDEGHVGLGLRRAAFDAVPFEETHAAAVVAAADLRVQVRVAGQRDAQQLVGRVALEGDAEHAGGRGLVPRPAILPGEP